MMRHLPSVRGTYDWLESLLIRCSSGRTSALNHRVMSGRIFNQPGRPFSNKFDRKLTQNYAWG